MAAEFCQIFSVGLRTILRRRLRESRAVAKRFQVGGVEYGGGAGVALWGFCERLGWFWWL